MRFFELIVEQEPVQPQADPNQPAQQPEKTLYADLAQTKIGAKRIAEIVASAGLDDSKVEANNKRPEVPHIRIKEAIPREAYVDAITKAGISLTNADARSKMASGNPTYQANTYNLTMNGITYTLVLAAKGGSDGKGAQIGTQQLRPNKLGLTGEGVSWSKTSLVDSVKKMLPSKIKDPLTAKALGQLLDVAAKTRNKIDPELMDHIRGAVNPISQDFGEILTPIMMADDDKFIITFPSASNEMLIDAEINGQPVAVKSLGGSGNSFAGIRDLINDYSDTKEHTKDKDYQEILDLIREFVSDKGATTDNVIRTAQKAKIPEVEALNKVLGTAPQSFQEMVTATTALYDSLVAEVGEKNAYASYIQKILPVSMAGNWLGKGKNPKPTALGLPSDWRKYSGNQSSSVDAEEEKPAKSTGKSAFDKNFPLFAAKQLTYMLGVGFDKEMNAGRRAAKMGETINSIMRKKNAIGARIAITNDGGLELIKTPFSDLNFRFQYHAATNAPDRNAPGFAIKF